MSDFFDFDEGARYEIEEIAADARTSWRPSASPGGAGSGGRFGAPLVSVAWFRDEPPGCGLFEPPERLGGVRLKEE
jgi:hypothetical protein